MAYQTTQAIVLRRVDYRDNDRILTLLTPERGRLDVLARGCRRPKSPLLAASELFSMGEYVLYKGRGHAFIVSCELSETFYPLRTDIVLLSHASLALSAAEAGTQIEEPAQHLYLLLARTLSRLSYGDMPPNAVTAAYLLHFMSIMGYRPILDRCVHCRCGLQNDAPSYLDPAAGGIACAACRGTLISSMQLTPASVSWMCEVLLKGIDKTASGHADALLVPLIRYTEYHIDRKLPRLIEL